MGTQRERARCILQHEAICGALSCFVEFHTKVSTDTKSLFFSLAIMLTLVHCSNTSNFYVPPQIREAYPFSTLEDTIAKFLKVIFRVLFQIVINILF